MNVTFPNKRGDLLSGVVEGTGEVGIVLCPHFTGFKEYKHYYRLAKSLVKAGFHVLRFDYADCIGSSQGTCEDMSVTHQVEDVLSAIDFLKTQGVKNIGLFGHSLGGLTAIAATCKTKVDALVVAAAPAKLAWDTLFNQRKKEWEEKGYVEFPSIKGPIKIHFSFYQDLGNYDATKIIEEVSCPVLVIHAAKDELITLSNTHGVFLHAKEPKEFLAIGGADHMFSGEYEKRLVLATTHWFTDWMLQTD
ncbi:alpha/beta fold hydrolase [Candidatus Woesearchaeota archaeon]|nr:MAG: alpha/beta fold hydrolase [Candidatus Woesearchaeota archaeon]